ncbi:MAG: tetratricopeptide repeat protein [candidate division KSB1 bacterium]|nr:tetratricopeptide repeat protein [candidate division KSB1 bacterium]
MRNRLVILIIILCGGMGPLHPASVQNMLNTAKKQRFDQQWDQAVQTYQNILNAHPESAYTEEVMFWLGFCYKNRGNPDKAFEIFGRLSDTFPQSPWTDDAVEHQILIAESQYEQSEYQSFLYNHLRNQDPDIRLEAALAVGRQGDRRALPVLKVYKDRDEQAKALVRQFNNETDKRPTPNNRRSPRDQIVYFPEDRFRQYKQLVKNANTWSRHELTLFGMWHVLSDEAFDTLYQKPMEAQKRLIDLYWRHHDPTLTTLENEARQEFNVRVLQAHQRFSYYDELDDFFYAPWDARGELLIKYGPPDTRLKVQDGEIWEYNRMDQISFYVRLSVTNIFGRGIFIHKYRGMSRKDMERSSISLKDLYEKYIFTPRFFFDLNRHFDLVDVTLEEKVPAPNGVTVSYSFPVDQMAWVEMNKAAHIQYVEHVVVYDDEFEMVTDQSLPCQVTRADEAELRKLGQARNIITLSLEPGDYTLGLRIKDEHSDKVGIAKRDITVLP